MIGHFKKKYTMKCEPHGTSNLDIKNAKQFGLQNASKNAIIVNFKFDYINTCITTKRNFYMFKNTNYTKE